MLTILRKATMVNFTSTFVLIKQCSSKMFIPKLSGLNQRSLASQGILGHRGDKRSEGNSCPRLLMSKNWFSWANFRS